jgi:molecular chaperone HscB
MDAAAGVEDPFALLGVPPTHALDAAQLRAALVRGSLRWHPDRFATSPAAQRDEAEERMAALNAAHAALADPLTRAEALLRLRGAPFAGGTDRVSCPAVLLGMLELREEAAAAGASADPAARAAAAARLRAEQQRCRAALAEACAAWEAAGAPAAQAGVVHARLAEASYVARTAEEFARAEAAT